MRFLIQGEYHLDEGEDARSALIGLGDVVAEMDGVTQLKVSILGMFDHPTEIQAWDLQWKLED